MDGSTLTNKRNDLYSFFSDFQEFVIHDVNQPAKKVDIMNVLKDVVFMIKELANRVEKLEKTVRVLEWY